MTTIDKIEKLEERVDKAFAKTVNGATQNKEDAKKAQKQYSKLDAQLQKLYKKVNNSPKLIEEYEEKYGCEWEF